MDTKSETLLNGLIEPQVESLVEEDSYYQALATPLKSASQWKQQHRQELKEFFKFKDLNGRLAKAFDLITHTMPSFASPEAYAKVKQEMDNSIDYFHHYMESMEATDRPILFQEMLGLSDETLLQIYAFGRNLVEKQNTEDALPLFTLLTVLAPHVESYWIAEGVCMQDLKLHEEAIAAFTCAKALAPQDPAPIAYTIDSYRAIKEDQLKQEAELLGQVLETLDPSEQAPWKEHLK